MNRLDLIIDALSVAQNSVWSALTEEALAAARELKAELTVSYKKPIQVRPAEFVATVSAGVGVDFVGTPMIWAEWPSKPEMPMSPEHLPQYIAHNNIKPMEGGGGGGAQPEQKPVIEIQNYGEKQVFVLLKPVNDGDKLYAAPTRKPWVGLTNEELVELREAHEAHIFQLMFAVEAKVKEKNGG